MNIVFVGTGYVGLVSGVMMASLGFNVTCIDNDISKINKLNNGEVPIYEPGLEDYLKQAIANKKISFKTNYTDLANIPEAVFITVGTPPLDNGSADLSYVMEATFNAAENLPESTLIIIKSTVPPSTTKIIAEQLHNKGFHHKLASNPEFLREGKAVYDFLNPDRIVIGVEDTNAEKIISTLYKSFNKLVVTDFTTAEMIKYASNAFLATKIAFINELSNICEKVGGDVDTLSYGMGLDSRISPEFLKVGPGFGGSCFPKDILALEYLARQYNEPFYVLSSVIEANEQRRNNIVDKIESILGNLDQKNIGVLGLTFKAGTDDIRSSPAIDIIKILQDRKANIIAYDPAGMDNASKLGLNIQFAKSQNDISLNSDALLILTEWEEFKNLDYHLLSHNLKSKIIFDYRNILNPEEVNKYGLKLYQLGKSIR